MRAPMMMHPAGETGSFRELFAGLMSFLRFLDPFAAAEGWHDDVRELSAPYMAVLMHKRGRMMGADLAGRTDPMRWAFELGDFIDSRIWPFLGAAGQAAGKAKVFAALDALVTQAAAGQTATDGRTPIASRFDASWAG